MTFDGFFRLTENGTEPRTEIMAGVTTFLTMAYIIFVQPAVLSVDYTGAPTGLDGGAVMLATCLSAALATILMGLYAGYPIALAPGMGENFFFVSVIMSLTALGVADSWRVAMGIVLISGLLFLLLSVLRVRRAIIEAVSPSMVNGIAAGIGIFIAFIGLKNGGVIAAKPGTFVGLNTGVSSTDLAVFLAGLIVAGVLHCRKIRGAILWGIAAACVLAVAMGKLRFQGIFGLPHIERRAAFNFSILGDMTVAKYIKTCLPFILVFTFMDMFDTVGTLLGVSQQAGLMRDNRLPRADRALLVDAAGTVVGACLGTSTVTSYVESAAGVECGGRTGLVSVVTGLLFLAALFFAPLVGMIGNYLPVTAPALVIVGAMMVRNAVKIDWNDYSESIPSFLTMIGIPLTFSIADGLALGFLSYPVVKLLSGRGGEVKWMMYLLAAVLVVYFVFVRTRVS